MWKQADNLIVLMHHSGRTGWQFRSEGVTVKYWELNKYLYSWFITTGSPLQKVWNSRCLPTWGSHHPEKIGGGGNSLPIKKPLILNGQQQIIMLLTCTLHHSLKAACWIKHSGKRKLFC